MATKMTMPMEIAVAMSKGTTKTMFPLGPINNSTTMRDSANKMPK